MSPKTAILIISAAALTMGGIFTFFYFQETAEVASEKQVKVAENMNENKATKIMSKEKRAELLNALKTVSGEVATSRHNLTQTEAIRKKQELLNVLKNLSSVSRVQ